MSASRSRPPDPACLANFFLPFISSLVQTHQLLLAIHFVPTDRMLENPFRPHYERHFSEHRFGLSFSLVFGFDFSFALPLSNRPCVFASSPRSGLQFLHHPPGGQKSLTQQPRLGISFFKISWARMRMSIPRISGSSR